ncbi:hypothetical protein CANINC_001747 [Pichia inconspicua]|uniref:C2H2-type domain-containing protein n=1 Tax=Pichia inconspicua TaxID=52247 RepID=A0A4T0X2U5_9ASCO|nr:hypothetical protein CANINC_001747 [[Candida] inconspicua]
MSEYETDGQFQDHGHNLESKTLEEKDHQSLDNQVNQYFKDIRYTTQEYDDDDLDDDDDDDNDDDNNDDDDDDDNDDSDSDSASDPDSEDYGDDEDCNENDFDDEGKLLEEHYSYDHNRNSNYTDSNIRRADQYNVVKYSNATVTGENAEEDQVANYNTRTGSEKYADPSVMNLEIQLDKEFQDLKTYFPSMTQRSEEIDYNAVLKQATSSRNDNHLEVQGSISERTLSSNKEAEPITCKQKVTQSIKRTCQFCSKTFQHVGSLGRHLDRQKGNALHPLEEVEKIRSNVVRRGNTEAIKERKLKRTREYNRREYVKERNRLRRKMNRKLERVKESYKSRFYRMINHPKLPSHPSFPRMVLFFLPANMWPHDPPTTQTFKSLISWLEKNIEVRNKIVHLTSIFGSMQNLLEKLTIAFENWQTLTIDERIDMWDREQRVISQQLLGNLTVFDFATRDMWAKQLVEIKKSDLLRHENENMDASFEQFDLRRPKFQDKSNSFTQLANTTNQCNSDDESQEGNMQIEMDISGITQIGFDQLVTIDSMQLSTVPILNIEEANSMDHQTEVD